MHVFFFFFLLFFFLFIFFFFFFFFFFAFFFAFISLSLLSVSDFLFVFFPYPPDYFLAMERSSKRPRESASSHGKPAAKVKPASSFDDATKVESPFILSVFNFKGGVGKTTLVANLAATLCEEIGKGVLLVDCDSQANLTTLFMEGDQHHQGAGNGDDDDDGDDVSTALTPQARCDTKADLVHQPLVTQPPEVMQDSDMVPTVEVAGGQHDMNIYTLMKPYFVNLNLRGALRKAAGTDPDPFEPKVVVCNRELFLIAGTPLLAQLEEQIGKDVASLRGGILFEGYAQALTRLGFFRHAVTLLAHRLRVKYVILDLGPSAGPLNEMFVLSSDAVLPPIFGDRFSRSSVEGLLTNIFPAWLEDHRKIVAMQRTEDAVAAYNSPSGLTPAGKYTAKGFIKLKESRPWIFPFLVNNYKFLSGKMCDPNVAWALSIRQFVAAYGDGVDPRRKRVVRQMLLPPDRMVLPLCHTDQRLALVAQKAMRPIVWLSGECSSIVPPSRRNLFPSQKRPNYDYFCAQFKKLASFVDGVRTQHGVCDPIEYDASINGVRVEPFHTIEPVAMRGIRVGYVETPPTSDDEGDDDEVDSDGDADYNE
jgi:cellulose biosynthesis protein BcsQ